MPSREERSNNWIYWGSALLIALPMTWVLHKLYHVVAGSPATGFVSYVLVAIALALASLMRLLAYLARDVFHLLDQRGKSGSDRTHGKE